LQEGEIQRVGLDKNIYVDVRIIAATNRDLSKEVEQGRFREDLYHRLSVFPLHIPALRDRIDDIPQLSSFILHNIKGKIGSSSVRVGKSAMHLLMQYDWPGNVRELQHVLMRAGLRSAAAINDNKGIIEPEHLGLEITRTKNIQHQVTTSIATEIIDADNKPFNEVVADFQRQIISKALVKHGNTWAKAARELQVDRANLYRLAKRLGINAN
jgi:anaerobic nitric oxide reductase transcription regulator